jgi:hypothetical protein
MTSMYVSDRNCYTVLAIVLVYELRNVLNRSKSFMKDV